MDRKAKPIYRLPYQGIIAILSVLVAVLLVIYLAVSVTGPAGGSAKVDLNSASLQELIEVPGIGKKTAERILSRRKNQRFRFTEEVFQLQGVTEANFEKMKDYISVD